MVFLSNETYFFLIRIFLWKKFFAIVIFENRKPKTKIINVYIEQNKRTTKIINKNIEQNVKKR